MSVTQTAQPAPLREVFVNYKLKGSKSSKSTGTTVQTYTATDTFGRNIRSAVALLPDAQVQLWIGELLVEEADLFNACGHFFQTG